MKAKSRINEEERFLLTTRETAGCRVFRFTVWFLIVVVALARWACLVVHWKSVTVCEKKYELYVNNRWINNEFLIYNILNYMNLPVL